MTTTELPPTHDFDTTVRPQDDFFDLGGSSLMAVQLSARLRQTLGAELAASAPFVLPANAPVQQYLTVPLQRPAGASVEP